MSTAGPRHPVPSVSDLVTAADQGLHTSIRRWTSPAQRRDALREQLAWSIDVAARDMSHAHAFRNLQPHSGAPAAEYLDRWLAVSDDLRVLAGPRYRDRDPARPFVAVTASDRPLTSTDSGALTRVLTREFAVFQPGYVLVWSRDAAGSWPGTDNDARLLAAPLHALRGKRIPSRLSVVRESDRSGYPRYVDVHAQARRTTPSPWLSADPEPEQAYADMIDRGTLWSVHVDGRWAGVLAGRDSVSFGMRGLDVVVLMLTTQYRGQGLGRHLTSLLASAVPNPAAQFLFGTIHHTNQPAYRSALAAGRVDVGGEVLIPAET